MSASIVLAAPASSSPKSSVSSFKRPLRVVVAPANGTSSCNVPDNKVADNECAVDSTPTPKVGDLKDRFEQLASAPNSPAGTSPRSACSRSSDQIHVVKFVGDNGYFVQVNTIKFKSATAGPATAAAVVLKSLAEVHVAALRASFEPTTVAVAAVAPAAPTDQIPAAVDTLASIAAPIKEIASCPAPAAAAPTAEKKLAAATEAVEVNVVNVVDSNLAVLSAELGSDQTLVDDHESTSRWSSFTARIGRLLGGASSTVKAPAVLSEPKPRSTKQRGVKVLPTTPSPVVVLRSAALVS
ncbi:hypothetical protein H9P43_003993 [Blastocladiella emersonii ATCC 22665]|nr:hypothetical protein H9P43_003993 [Blastocladiella emersonii ATCC 22665]